MAHECPECGQVCHCNGDIDDLILNDEDDIINCNHYQTCEDYDFDYDDEADFAS